MNGKAPKPFGFFVAGNQRERKQLLHGRIKLKISLNDLDQLSLHPFHFRIYHSHLTILTPSSLGRGASM